MISLQYIDEGFIGNEADLIIISVVRTEGIGFLENERRLNVMLSRCKRGMWIACNLKFLLSESCAATLLGRMAKEWRDNGEPIYSKTAPGGPFSPSGEVIRIDHAPRKAGMKSTAVRPPLPPPDALIKLEERKKKKSQEAKQAWGNQETYDNRGKTGGKGKQTGSGKHRGTETKKGSRSRDESPTKIDLDLQGWGTGEDWSAGPITNGGGWGDDNGLGIDAGWTRDSEGGNGGWDKGDDSSGTKSGGNGGWGAASSSSGGW